MLFLKQLRNVNLEAVRKLSTAVHHTSKFNKNGENVSYLCRNSNVAVISSSTNILMTKSPNVVNIRHHYRNYEYHPSPIIRAYRRTRTWLTDHFVLAENRFENIYSFTFLVTVAILLMLVGWLDLQVGGESGGLDVNRLPPDQLNNDSNKK